ncbi:MAG: hypothetical protein JSU59_04560 [Nitrospirota bacterium]|nr:MAG: hypothetical protein JSU59_04560 [Nitrospirota bacterium]
MREDFGNNRGIFNGGNERDRAATVGTACHVDLLEQTGCCINNSVRKYLLHFQFRHQGYKIQRNLEGRAAWSVFSYKVSFLA